VNIDQAFELLAQVRAATGHNELVVIGSNAALALSSVRAIPNAMTMSIDVGAFTPKDPGRIFDLAPSLGEGSEFHRQHGYYLDPVSPDVATLPRRWQGRLIPVERDGATLWFLDPNDAAISKYARGEPRDRRWIQAGLIAGVIEPARVQLLLEQTTFIDGEEEAGVRKARDEDSAWLAGGPVVPAVKGPYET